MHSGNTAFIQVLRLRSCEFWHIRNDASECKSRGALQVLYSETLDLFVLKIESSKLALVQDLQVTGISGLTDASRSYIFPALDGSHIIKIQDQGPGYAIENFETILDNTTHFLHKTGLVDNLTLSQLHEAEERVIEKHRSKGLHKFVNKISKVIAPSKNEAHANQKIPRSFDELIKSEDVDVIVVDISRDEVQHLIEEARKSASNYRDISAEEERKPFKVDPNVERWFTEISSRLEHENENIVLEDISASTTSFASTDQRILPETMIRASESHQGIDFSKVSISTDIS